MKVRLLRSVPSTLHRPDGSMRFGYVIDADEIGIAERADGGQYPDGVYNVTVRGRFGTAIATMVPRSAFTLTTE